MIALILILMILITYSVLKSNGSGGLANMILGIVIILAFFVILI
jgi:hypothetical protein